MSPKYVIALDQGTSSSRAIVFDNTMNIVNIAQYSIQPSYPRPGWIEHNAIEIWNTQKKALDTVLQNINIQHVVSLGITNQRETTVVWDKTTGYPVYNAIVWSCNRTIDLCQKMKQDGFDDYVRQHTGLYINPYFSGTKLKWILENIPHVYPQAQKGNLLFGTIDTWLIWNMTQGKVHATDYTNASRTLLFNIHTCTWDPVLLDYFNIPSAMLPEIKASSSHYGNVTLEGYNIPISGVAGDQQASLFGQSGSTAGTIKNTYGTGCFLLANTGIHAINSQHGLLTTIAATEPNVPLQYALEGAIFVGGSIVQWLKQAGLLSDPYESGPIAESISSTDGVYFVPAFSGLGAPYWYEKARGILVGLTHSTQRVHIVRAALEAIAYQSKDIIQSMQQDTQTSFKILNVDGGATKNNFLMQFQADITGMTLIKNISESSALGAALLAGLTVNFWPDTHHITKSTTTITPLMQAAQTDALYQHWKKAVACAVHYTL